MKDGYGVWEDTKENEGDDLKRAIMNMGPTSFQLLL